MASNPNSLSDTSQWFLSPLLVASHFSFFMWLLFFLWLFYSDIIISNKYVIPAPFLCNTHFIQYWGLCDLHVALSIFVPTISLIMASTVLQREREHWLFKQSFELPLFRGQILQPLPHCNIRVGGWKCPQDSCYVFHLYKFNYTSILCIRESFTYA